MLFKMTFKTNLAYSGNALPRQQKSPAGIKRVRSFRRFNPIRSIFAVLIVSGLLVFLIFSMVRMNEIVFEVNSLEKEYKVQQSEYIRLNCELERKMGYSNLEEYAKAKWGMKKQSSNQIIYVNSSLGNSIEIDEENSKSILDSLIDAINNLFS